MIGFGKNQNLVSPKSFDLLWLCVTTNNSKSEPYNLKPLSLKILAFERETLIMSSIAFLLSFVCVSVCCFVQNYAKRWC